MRRGDLKHGQEKNFSFYRFRFYETEVSIVGDPELGPILSSLMVGPCALEFTRLNSDTLWSVLRISSAQAINKFVL